MSDNIPLNQQNVAVKSWFSSTYQKIRSRYMRLIRSPNRSGDGFDRLKFATRQTLGEIDSGNFRFDRHLVFVHKGAGRGQAGSKGTKWYDPHGKLKSTNTLSFGKMNTGKRHAEEWLNPVLDEEVPKLADIIAGFKSDHTIKQIQIR